MRICFYTDSCRNDNGKVWVQGKTPPIVLMGLLDTVGAEGLPRINTAWAVNKPVMGGGVPMRDLAVSSEVQNVFQACATHDRLAAFEPCCVRRDKQYLWPQLHDDSDLYRSVDRSYKVAYATEEVWYPGVPYG